MSHYTRLAHQAVTEGVNLKYVEKMRQALYQADAELTSLRAELEQTTELAFDRLESINRLLAELEQAQKELAAQVPRSDAAAFYQGVAQRFREALERIETDTSMDWHVLAAIARDALVGDQ